MLAKAVAWEAGVPFFVSSWSEFMEMLVWMWAAKVRELFNKAKTASPSIIFIDEIDAIGKKRWLWYTWWHQEQEQTLNQILTEMDWFTKDHTVIVIAATNRPDVLDPALLRPGRFDRKVYVWKPTLGERKEIFDIYMKNKKISREVDMKSLAIRTVDFVWADIANLVNEAALRAASQNRHELTVNDFEYALEKIVMWPEKKTKSVSEEERKKIAYHELWHAITAHYLKNTDPVEKISIVSRWMALGVTWMMPKEDKYLYSKAKMEDEIVSLLGWRIAEEVFFGPNEITTWASNDMSRVYKMVYNMITKYGMSWLWPIMYFDDNDIERKPYKQWSEDLSKKIDDQIEYIINKAYKQWKELIVSKKPLIHKMALVLLKKEYLTKDLFLELVWDKKAENAKQVIWIVKKTVKKPVAKPTKTKVTKKSSPKTKK